MKEHDFKDVWANVTTRNGIRGDEVISMLQKSIRRGIEEDALDAAYEMYSSSPQFEEKLWRRLLAISVEDIGFGDINAGPMVYTYSQMRLEFPYGDLDRAMFFVQAVRYLCRATKERSSNSILALLVWQFEAGRKPVVPDYALDTHTRAGRAKGRDLVHFIEEASQVEPLLEPDEYGHEQARQKLLEYTKNPPKTRADNPFVHFTYQT